MVPFKKVPFESHDISQWASLNRLEEQTRQEIQRQRKRKLNQKQEGEIDALCKSSEPQKTAIYNDSA